MKKTVLLVSLVFLIGLTAAQPAGEIPGNATDMGNMTGITDLPGQASDTAKQVTNAISKALQNGVRGLGETLRNLARIGQQK